VVKSWRKGQHDHMPDRRATTLGNRISHAEAEPSCRNFYFADAAYLIASLAPERSKPVVSSAVKSRSDKSTGLGGAAATANRESKLIGRQSPRREAGRR